MTDPGLVADCVSGLSPEHAAIVRRLVRILDAVPMPLEAEVRWSKLTYAFGGDFHHWICAIAPAKKSVGLCFHFGGLFEVPAVLFKAGTS